MFLESFPLLKKEKGKEEEESFPPDPLLKKKEKREKKEPHHHDDDAITHHPFLFLKSKNCLKNKTILLLISFCETTSKRSWRRPPKVPPFRP
jgi:hypothetical protein